MNGTARLFGIAQPKVNLMNGVGEGFGCSAASAAVRRRRRLQTALPAGGAPLPPVECRTSRLAASAA